MYIDDETTEIIEQQTIANLVNAFKMSCDDIQMAAELMNRAQERFSRAFTDPYGFPSYKIDPDCMIKDLTRRAWSRVVDLTQIRPLMSISARKKFDDQISSGDVPDLTEETVMSVMFGLINNAPNLLHDNVKEIFQWLTPKRGRTAKLKTNDQFQIGKKVIVDGVIEFCTYPIYWNLSYYRDDNLNALDNIMSMLDGKGISKHPFSSATSIRDAMRQKKQECETEYFRFKWFKNGALHIEFKRLDLLKELNRLGSGGEATLRGNRN